VAIKGEAVVGLWQKKTEIKQERETTIQHVS